MLVLFITLSIIHNVTSLDAACDPSKNTLLYSETNNPFGPKPLTTAETVTGLQYCKSLEGQKSCCSADTINSFKSNVGSLVSNINKNSKALDEDSKKFIKAAAKMKLESANYTSEMKKLNESSSVTERILLKVFQRVLQLNDAQQKLDDAQKKGKEMLNEASKKGGMDKDSALEKAEEKLDEAQKKGKEMLDEASKKGGMDKDSVKEKGKEMLNEAKKKGLDKDSAKKKGKEMMKEMMQKKGKKQINTSKKPKGQKSLDNIKKKFGGDSADDFKKIIKVAQKARAKCFKYLGYLKAQFSCMACDYTNMTSALTAGSLSLNSNICSSVQSNCYDYANLNQNVSLMRNGDKMQQQLNKISKQRKQLNQINGNITKMEKELEEGGVDNTNSTQVKIENAMKSLNESQLEDQDSDKSDTFYATKLPANCTSNTTCEYLCSYLVKLDKGGVDFKNAQNPGMNVSVNVSDSNSMEQIKSQESIANQRRILASLSNEVTFSTSAPSLAEETELQKEVESIQEDPAEVSSLEVDTKLEDESTMKEPINAVSLQFSAIICMLLVFLNFI